MHDENNLRAGASETDRLTFLLSCYDVWSASRSRCGEDGYGEASCDSKRS